MFVRSSVHVFILRRPTICHYRYAVTIPKPKINVTQWLVPKGVDLHCQQGHAFQKPIKTLFKIESCNTNRGSATTALRYLSSSALGTSSLPQHTLKIVSAASITVKSTWSSQIYITKTFPVTPCLTAVIAHALLKVLSRAFAMMVKPTDRYRQLPSFGGRRAVRRMTLSTVHLLDADHSDLT